MKIVHVLLLAAALPAGVAAQQPAAPPANPLATVFQRQTASRRLNIAQALDSIPESKYGYKPTPSQMTIGEIAQHVAYDNYFWCSTISGQKPDASEKDMSTPDSVRAKWPKAMLMTKLKESNTFCDAAMAQLNDAKVTEMMAVPAANGQTRQVPRMSYLVGHALDLADHYSQLANYMRLNGMLPPTALPRPAH